MNYHLCNTFLSEQECQRWIDRIEGLPQRKGDNKYNRFESEVTTEFWKKIREYGLLPETTGGSGRITLVKYAEDSKGMYKHLDTIREKGVKYTGIIYLNENEGDTVLYEGEKEIRITPRTGRLLLLDVSIPHEGIAPKGIKYILVFRLV